MKERYFITLEIELGVIILKTSHVESSGTCITPVHGILPLSMCRDEQYMTSVVLHFLRWWKLAYKMSFC